MFMFFKFISSVPSIPKYSICTFIFSFLHGYTVYSGKRNSVVQEQNFTRIFTEHLNNFLHVFMTKYEYAWLTIIPPGFISSDTIKNVLVSTTKFPTKFLSTVRWAVVLILFPPLKTSLLPCEFRVTAILPCLCCSTRGHGHKATTPCAQATSY